MKWPWNVNRYFDENRKLRGELAHKLVELDRSRLQLDQQSRDTSLRDMLHTMLLKMDEKRD